MPMSVGYYADMRREGKGTLLLAGPYRTHPEAIKALEWARRHVLDNFSGWHAFDSYGTCKLTATESRPILPRGKFTPIDFFDHPDGFCA